MSRYAIRHATSGLERSFEDKQAIADFFHAEGNSPADWEGHQCLGELPAPATTGEIPVSDPVAAQDGAPAEVARETPAPAKASRTARAVAAVKKAVTPKKKVSKK